MDVGGARGMGGWWLVDGGWWLVEGGWWTVDGGRWTVDGGRWTVDGGRWTEKKWPAASFVVCCGPGLLFCSLSTNHRPLSTLYWRPTRDRACSASWRTRGSASFLSWL